MEGRAGWVFGRHGIWHNRRMSTLRYTINVTLDGCCDHMAVVPTEAMHRYSAAGIAGADALLFGRVIYRMMEEAWRPVAETGIVPDWMDEWMVPFARTIHAAKKYVVSDSLEAVDWNAELIRGGELIDTVSRLKREPGGLISLGGMTLPLALASAGVIDEYEFIVHPRVAGHGPILLAGLPVPLDLRLVNEQPIGDGIVARRYVPAG